MNTLNQAIENALKFANSQTNSGTNFLSSTYDIVEFWENKETVEWDDLCKFASETHANTTMPKFSLCIIVYLLENNQYQGKHKEKLMQDLPYLKRCINEFKPIYALIFKGDYDELHFIDRPVTEKIKGLTVKRLFNCNNFFGSLYINYLEDVNKSYFYGDSSLDYDFMRSITSFEINSLDDIDSSLFWHQASFFKSFYSEDEKTKKIAIRNLCRFYRWLLVKYNEHIFFKNSTNLSYELIFSGSFVNQILNDAYFTTFSSTEDLGDKSKIVFIVKNLQSKSTIAVKNIHFYLCTDALETSTYRTIINKYFQNAATPSMLTNQTDAIHIVDALHLIEQVKKQKEYPNPEPTNFCTQEARMIRDYYRKNNPDLALTSLNSKIGSIRRFLTWAMKCDYLTFDATFFDYLSQYEEPNMYRGHAISDNDIENISNAFIELCDEDSSYKLYYAIFLILIETEFRVSQVCNLTVSALQPTLKNDQYFLYSNTKTSNGRKTTQPICSSTKKILESVINDTESLRNEVLSESYRDHIFIYRSKNLGNTVKGITSVKFLETFKKVCERAGTKKYNSRNLRDTHMTKAFEYILRHGKSDFEMGVLSKHRHIDTTKSHYIEVELTKMLESTYQVTLGNRDINQQSHILDSLPDNLASNETLVEGGCGHCMAKTCHMTGSLPCLICKDFVTTVDRKPYFIKMICNCDELLKKATIRHEVEDISLIKTLYTSWLREICIKEEENNDSTSNS